MVVASAMAAEQVLVASNLAVNTAQMGPVVAACHDGLTSKPIGFFGTETSEIHSLFRLITGLAQRC